MTRSLAVVCLVALFACSSIGTAFAGIHDVAPADEYFGPFKESILGIRNRLVAFEGKADDELVIADTIHGIDNVERAIEDWQVHYPRDPWIAGFLDRMVHVYGRAHALETQRAKRAYGLLVHMYSRTKAARDALAYVAHTR